MAEDNYDISSNQRHISPDETNSSDLNVFSATEHTTQKEHQVRSDSYNGFVNIQPKFFERFGVLLIALFILLILIASCFINYPEVIRATIKVQSVNAPKELITKINGKVIKLLKTNNDKIKKGDNILFIESTANHVQVLMVYEKINNFINNLNSTINGSSTISLTTISQNKNEIYQDKSNNKEVATAKNIAEIKGLFYTIQISKCSKPSSAEKLLNLQPLYTETCEDGMIKYYAGIYYTYAKAVEAQNMVINMSIKDAFIKAFKNNTSITLADAKKLESNDSINTNYSIISPTTDFDLFNDNNYSQLGELQTALQTFQTSYFNYLDYQSAGVYAKKKNIILNDIEILKQLIGLNSNQKNGAGDELKYVEERSKKNESLYQNEVIARDDYVTTYLSYLSKKNSLYQYDLTNLNYASQINQKLRELMEIEEQAKKQNQLLSESAKTLKSQFDEWINKYIVKAPEAGVLSYTSFIQENQMVETGKKIAIVIPANNENFVEMYIPQNMYPKIKLYQRVLLKFPAFPSQDYGYVKGYISFISPVANDSAFLAKITCSNGFKTTQKIQLNVKHGMTGVGEIIIKDKTIMGRIISKFTEKFQNVN